MAVQLRPARAAHEAAGFALAVLAWAWVALPFLTGGVTGVKNMLRAKFTNRGPDGKYLP